MLGLEGVSGRSCDSAGPSWPVFQEGKGWMMVFPLVFVTSSQTIHPWPQEDLPSQMAGADHLATCPHGPDPLTSASWLISSCWFNINPEGSGLALRVLGADTLWRTSEACGYLAAWPWLPC